MDRVRCSSPVEQRLEDCARWALQAPEPIVALEADDSRVIVTTASLVSAVHAVAGWPAWGWKTTGGVSQLRLSAGVVFVLDATGRRLAALDADDGTVLWESDRQGPAGLSAGQEVVALRHTHAITALHATTGETLWTAEDLPAGETPVIIAGDVLVDAAKRGLQAYDLRSGRALWSAAAAGDPVIAAGLLLARSGDGIVARDPVSGEQVWSRPDLEIVDLAVVDDEHVGIVQPVRIEILEARTGEPVLTLGHRSVAGGADVGASVAQPATVHAAVPGAFLASVGATVQRWDLEGGGPSWRLHAVLADTPRFVTIQPAPDTSLLIAPLWDQTLVAFLVPEPRAPKPPPFECEGAVQDLSLGGRAGWRGQRGQAVVVADAINDFEFHQVAIGIPGADYDTSLTVSARSLDRKVFTAVFNHAGGPWEEQLTLGSGARTADGWPTHWVVQARFPRSGCWEIHISTGKALDTVTVPIDAQAPETAPSPDGEADPAD